MAGTRPQPDYIPLQVGSELRITEHGDLKLSNPETEAGPNEVAADAVITYYRDPETKEHVIRLIDPLHARTRRDRA